MSSRQRGTTYLVLGVLWASGCVWLVLDQFFKARSEFGVTPHAWAAPTLLLHGILAVLSTYLLGWITARHASHWWRRHLRRLSGGTLTAFLALLALSGFALFFLTDERWQEAARVAHDLLGLGITAVGLQHWFFGKIE